jgi:membrane-bound lytic murein transglycosylase A
MSEHLQPIGFESLNGWAKDDHLAAMVAFLQSARHMVEKSYKTRALGVSSSALVTIAHKALDHPPFTRTTARSFFEDNFKPHEVVKPGEKAGSPGGFVTAYYEPEVNASRVKTDKYPVPLYRRPADLVDVTNNNRPHGFNPDTRFARSVEGSPLLTEYPDRQAIEAGYLLGKGLEIAFVKDKVEALFIHIQGSACLCFDDGTSTRIGYAAKSGHPYTAVGKILLQGGELVKNNCGMRAIRDWFAQNPDQVNTIINQNRSYIFFKENPVKSKTLGPIGAAKAHLTSHRSLAVDRLLHTFGSPVWIETTNPLPEDKTIFARLMVAQDTGSAIIGPGRGDLFLGSGNYAGKIAGNVSHAARFVVFVPREYEQ